MTLTKQAGTHTAFILLHTPEEYIVFGDNRIVIEFGNVRTSMPGNEITTLKLVKKGKTVYNRVSWSETKSMTEADLFEKAQKDKVLRKALQNVSSDAFHRRCGRARKLIKDLFIIKRT